MNREVEIRGLYSKLSNLSLEDLVVWVKKEFNLYIFSEQLDKGSLIDQIMICKFGKDWKIVIDERV